MKVPFEQSGEGRDSRFGVLQQDRRIPAERFFLVESKALLGRFSSEDFFFLF